MKKTLLFLCALVLSIQAKSQFTQSDLIYYVGSGPDTAVCVIDFLDGTPDSSYAWGFLFDASSTVTAEDMLDAIDTDESTLDIAMAGGFLNDIDYNAHTGIGGSPNYWGTWSRTGITSWTSNAGIGEVLANGDWFGCSYTDFSPAVEPGEPIAAYESAKFQHTDVRFWVGTGSDTAYLVLDFVADVYGEQVSYAWGYVFDGSTDGATMLADIDAADVNLSVATAGGFLNDITFNDLSGIGGNPYYWGTWSGTNLSDWTMNLGLSTPVNNGDWFGCSYAAWQPRRPFYPNPAQDPASFTVQTVDYFYGSGADTAVIVIDFNESAIDESFAFGYLFDAGTVTAEDAMTDLDAAGDLISMSIAGGFLNDITYGTFDGIGGAPYYWSTWSATNIGGWELNAGLSEILANGDWFGCSYSAWTPATFPSIPIPGLPISGVSESMEEISVYPNPTNGEVMLTVTPNSRIQLFDLNGRLVMEEIALTSQHMLDLSALESGVYQLMTINGRFSWTTENN